MRSLTLVRDDIARQAPRAPLSLAELVARVFVHPQASSDVMLIFADGIRAYAEMPSLNVSVRADMIRLADMLAAEAPQRANIPLIQETLQ